MNSNDYISMFGIWLTLMGFGYMLLTGYQANQSVGFKFGQAIGVWPSWVVEQMAISLVVFGVGAGIIWWRLGKRTTIQ